MSNFSQFCKIHWSFLKIDGFPGTRGKPSKGAPDGLTCERDAYFFENRESGPHGHGGFYVHFFEISPHDCDHCQSLEESHSDLCHVL